MRRIFIILACFVFMSSCSSIVDESVVEEPVIMKVKEGERVYVNSFGEGIVYTVVLDNGNYEPYIKVAFGLTVLIFNKEGECRIGSEVYKMQPSKTKLTWD